MGDFTYESLQFCGDLQKLDLLQNKDKMETYFDTDRETPENNLRYDPYENDPLSINDSFNSDQQEEDSDRFYSPAINMTDTKKLRVGLRKSLSTTNLHDMQKLENEVENLTNLLNEKQVPKTKCENRTTFNSSSQTSLTRSRLYGSKDAIPSGNKYVSMTEAMYRFHHKTPTRFHTKSKHDQVKLSKYAPIPCTIPQSPALSTKTRNRPVTAMTTEQRELIEFEEAQKFKIKANPVNQRVLQGPLKASVSVIKKPVTEIQPFNLTEVAEKVAKPVIKKPEFHANPVPKCLSEPMKLVKETKKRTIPVTPNVMKRSQLRRPQSKENLCPINNKKTSSAPLTRTIPQPFSFESRSKKLMKKREELIQRVNEEEQKQRIFNARPAPKNLLKSPKIKPKMCGGSLKGSKESLKSDKSDGGCSVNSSTSGSFKARPAKVLQMEPFIPKKLEHPLIEINEFQLNTVRRAKEREVYEREKQERLEIIDEMRRLKEEEERCKEEEEIAALRKEITPVANPIRSYKPIKTVLSKPVTSPKTPNFSTDKFHPKKH